MRADAASVWPHARRRARRSVAAGRQRGPRERVDERAGRATASTAVNWSGRLTSCTNALEPLPIARQKKSVAVVPNTLPAGTAKLRSRQSSDHRIGSVHCVLRFGPVGPLKNAGRSSPQRPWKAIQGKLVRASFASLGIVSTAGRRSWCGPVVSSQPTPCSAELPRNSPSSKKFACEPAAGYTTGWVPPTSSSLSAPQSARSAPSCWL